MKLISKSQQKHNELRVDAAQLAGAVNLNQAAVVLI